MMAVSFLATGTPAPPFELQAVTTRRMFSPAACWGTLLPLVLISYSTRAMVREILQAVREREPGAGQVLVANQINLDFVSRLARGIASRWMDSELKQAARQLEEEYNPHDHQILLQDWKGTVNKIYRIVRIDEQQALVLVDGEGLIVGSYRGADPTGAAVAQVAVATGKDGRRT